MYEVGASLGANAGGGFIAGGNGRLAESYLRAVTFDSAKFYGWRIFWHHYPGFYTAPGAGTGDGSAVVATRLGDDAMRNLGLGEREDGICGAANFEGAGFLKIITFEKNVGAGEFIERRTGQYGSAMYFRNDARVRLFDGVPRGRREIFDSCRFLMRGHLGHVF